MEAKQVRSPKVLNSVYKVKVNGELLGEGKESLKEIRDVVRDLKIDDTVQNVSIVRHTVSETVISTFEPKSIVSLVAVDELGLD